jgi:hypothetical protein
MRGDSTAWLAAAVGAREHPRPRRALYALLGRSARMAKSLWPELPVVRVTDQFLDFAGRHVFGGEWPAVRHHWGLPMKPIDALFVTPHDPVTTFGKAAEADGLAWAAAHLPDPFERAAAFDALEDLLRCS